MRVLEVSLRKAGFTVTTAASVQDALDKLEVHAPDLIISETTFPDGDGFELRRRVRATPDWAEIPFIFLTAEAAIENKIRGLELGVDDYLTKPIYIKEIVTRINILLQKRQRVRFEERRDGRTRFAGRVADMPVVDVIQTIEISRKSGVIQFVGDRNRQAAIYFRDGRVIDAEAGALQGEDAVYRLLTWNEGEFEVVFRTVRRREVIQTSSQGLLMEGMRRLDEWSRLLEQLPALGHRFEVDVGELATRLGDVPDDNNPILRLIDGRRTLLEVIDASDVGDLECLQAISRLYFEELLIDLDHGTPVRHPTGKPVPLTEVEAPTPIEDAASGPIPETSNPMIPVFRSAPIAPEPAYTDPAPDVISEELAPGALSGAYRPSSLRLIDEAVAAAQAIEPSMFEDDEQPPSPGRGRNLVADPGSANGVHATLHDASPENVPETIDSDDHPTPRPARRETSGPIPRTASEMRREGSGPMSRTATGDRREGSGPMSRTATGDRREGSGPTSRTATGEMRQAIPRTVTGDWREGSGPASRTATGDRREGSGPMSRTATGDRREGSGPTSRTATGEMRQAIPRTVSGDWREESGPASRTATGDRREESGLVSHTATGDRREGSGPTLTTTTGEMRAMPRTATGEMRAMPRTATGEMRAAMPRTTGEMRAAMPRTATGEMRPAIPRTLTREPTAPVARVSGEVALPLGKDDSGLRMIGSLGHDRAEAFGELAPAGSGVQVPRSETQRELVTIMPRRITRELTPIPGPLPAPDPDKPRRIARDLTPLPGPLPKDDKRVATEDELGPATDDAPRGSRETGETPVPAPPVEPPADSPSRSQPLGPPRRRTTTTTTQAAASGTRIASGPGPGALALIILAAILAGIAIYLRMRRTPHEVETGHRGGQCGAHADPGAGPETTRGGTAVNHVDHADPRGRPRDHTGRHGGRSHAERCSARDHAGRRGARDHAGRHGGRSHAGRCSARVHAGRCGARVHAERRTRRCLVARWSAAKPYIGGRGTAECRDGPGAGRGAAGSDGADARGQGGEGEAAARPGERCARRGRCGAGARTRERRARAAPDRARVPGAGAGAAAARPRRRRPALDRLGGEDRTHVLHGVRAARAHPVGRAAQGGGARRVREVPAPRAERAARGADPAPGRRTALR
ncbi:MAG: DUF4388 domain-containing protein [Deltaproteobacteria bacterium]|nr:DUF4388 domain-containing protein [Deltaproteobacteria bacterium]